MMLNGARILVTRPAHQADNLSRLITDHGGQAVRLPTLAIEMVADTTSIQNTLAQLHTFQWAVFMSANAVNFALMANHGLPKSTEVRYVAIGQATAHALQAAQLPVDLMPIDTYNSAALLALPELQTVAGQRFLCVCGANGRDELAVTLQQRGAIVIPLIVYQRILPSVNTAPVLYLLENQQLNIITITSGEALQNLIILLGTARLQLLTLPLIVVSDRIKQLAMSLGFQHVVVTTSPSDTAILETIITVMRKLK